MRASLIAALLLLAAGPAAASDRDVAIFDGARIDFDPALDAPDIRDGYLVRDRGQVVEATVALPPAPDDQRDARRIEAVVTTRPIMIEDRGQVRPKDVWTRLGSLSVVVPDAPAGAVELMRFMTGFGAAGTFRQDVTVFAPLLHGRRTLRLSLSTVSNPGWEVRVELEYRDAGAGYRRPDFVGPLVNEAAITSQRPTVTTTIEIPEGLARPRLRVLSTGHSSDAGPENEFVTCTHRLRIDGREFVVWRPWAEGGGDLRDRNPWAGREVIDGREVWSSDLDRSGWQPGTVVQPLIVPAPVLTPGPHEVQIEILWTDFEGLDHDHGYWRLSAVVVADEPWPAVDHRTPDEGP